MFLFNHHICDVTWSCFVLYYTVQCTLQYCTVLYCTLLYCTVLYCGGVMQGAAGVISWNTAVTDRERTRCLAATSYNFNQTQPSALKFWLTHFGHWVKLVRLRSVRRYILGHLCYQLGHFDRLRQNVRPNLGEPKCQTITHNPCLPPHNTRPRQSPA